MKKAQYYEQFRLREEVQRREFYEFMNDEGFTLANDEVGNFAIKMPLFYKQISENKFLVFNIPYFGKIKLASFQSDFWLITAISSTEFLNHKLLDENLEHLLLGFELEKDLVLFKAVVEETTH